MRRLLVALMVALFSVVMIAPEAEAKRLGGGKSMGRQSDMTNRDAARPPSAAPAAPAAAAGAAAAAGKRSWMGPLAGLAAGLGLAALASYLGFGEELANLMLIALLAFGVLIAVRMFMARRNAAAGGRQPALAGAAAGGASGRPMFRQDAPQWPARESASTGSAGSAALGGAAAGAAVAAVSPDVPAGFDVDKFLHHAKVYFVRLQAASDKKEISDIREFTSPEMFAELNLELMQRGDEPQVTDVVRLDARLLGVETQGDVELAGVRFSGMLREAADAAAEPFEEVWNFSRPLDRSAGWVLSGIQQIG